MLADIITPDPENWVVEILTSIHAIWVVAVVPVGILAWGWLRRDSCSETTSRWLTWLAFGMVVGFSLLDLAIIAGNVKSPRDWDFNHFWTWGAAVVEGTNPYDHENLLRVAEPLKPSEALRDELYCFYPPMSLLLFAPLGWLPYKVALAVWNLVQALVLVACLRLMVHLFAPERSWKASLTLAALCLAYWGTSATFAFSQTNFLVLLCLLLFWRDRERASAGLWVGLGMVVKPLVAAVALYLLVRRRWNAMIALVATLAASVLVTCLAFGPGIFQQFLDREGISDNYLLAQDANQSLSGFLLRAMDLQVSARHLTDAPVVLLAVGGVVLATGLIVLRSSGRADPYAVGLTLAMMVLVYPGTLTHYGVQLLPPMMLLLFASDPPRHRQPLILAVLLLAYLASAFKVTFVAITLVWLAMAVEALRRDRADT